MSTKRRVPFLLGMILPFAAALALAVPAHAQTGAPAGTSQTKHHHSSTHQAKATPPAKSHKKPASTTG